MRFTMAAVIPIGQGGMGGIGVLGNAQRLPLGNVVVGDAGIIGGVVTVAGQVGNDRHGLDTNHALESQVGLVANYASQYFWLWNRCFVCTYARDPAKSSVEIWLAGYKASSTR